MSHKTRHDVSFHHGESHKIKLLEDIKTNTENINVNVGDVEINVQDVEALLTTTNTKLSGGLPPNLTGSGNLKVSIQELGNEGSERLNVDIGDDINQLPSALTSEGNLKVSIQEDFTHNLSTSAKQDTQITHLSNIDTGIDVLEACVGSDKVNVNISSGNITGFATSANQTTANGHLSALAGIINPAIANATATTIPARLDTINTSLGDLATESTLQTIAEFNCDTTDVTITSGIVLPSSLTGSGNLKVSIQELGNEGSERLNVDIGDDINQLPSALSGSGRLKIENDFDGVISNSHLSELGTAINSAKVDVNISSGNISGFATSALQRGGLPSALSSDNLKVSLKETIDLPITNAGLTELASAINSDKVDVNISSGGFDGVVSGTVTANLSATDNAVLDVVASKATLSTTCEVKEFLSSATINAGSLSAQFDTENYEHSRFFGQTTASVGTDIILMGSNADGGTFYVLGENLRSETIGSTHYIYSPEVNNLPRYIKLLNKSGSTNYIFTKLYFQGSGGRLAV